MRLRLSALLTAVAVVGLWHSASQACSFPLVNPPPYAFYNTWRPGPRTINLSIDARLQLDGYRAIGARRIQLEHLEFCRLFFGGIHGRREHEL